MRRRIDWDEVDNDWAPSHGEKTERLEKEREAVLRGAAAVVPVREMEKSGQVTEARELILATRQTVKQVLFPEKKMVSPERWRRNLDLLNSLEPKSRLEIN